MPVRLEPAAPLSQVRYSTTEPLRSHRKMDEATAAGDLLDPKELIIGLYVHGIVGQDLKNTINMQAILAKRRDNQKWLGTAAKEAIVFIEETFLDSNRVDENLYMVKRVTKKAKRWTESMKCTTGIRTIAQLEPMAQVSLQKSGPVSSYCFRRCHRKIFS